jgi:UDP:flavonoid glycosyltransferase YjiC (YdhE family)
MRMLSLACGSRGDVEPRVGLAAQLGALGAPVATSVVPTGASR